MKTKSQFTTIILILLFVLLFLSCNDSLVTENITQEKKPNTALNKQSSMIVKPKIKLPQFRHDTDTTNSNGTKAPDCRYRYIHGWSIQSYSPKPNKYLGVWGSTSPVTWEQYFNKYGFLSISVSDINSYNTAKNIGYTDDNLAVHINSYYSATSQMNSMNNAKYYFIDEPLERGTFTSSNILSLATFLSSVNSTGKLMLTSYKWPTWYWSFPTTYGDKYSYILNSRNNTYIVCDEYPGNYFGTTAEYRTKFSNYYGYNKHIADWIHINKNNPYTGEGDGFSTLFSNANSLGIDRVWLYALSDTNPTHSKINRFCHYAWQSGWLRGYAKNYTLVYKCLEPNPCENCGENDYYLYKIIWYDNLYEVYP